MTNNAEIALQALINGNIIVHDNQKYVLSDDYRVCKIQKENNLEKLVATDISLERFIKMSQEIPRETLIIASLPR